MPELPEVEIVKLGLCEIIKAPCKIKDVNIFTKKLRWDLPENLIGSLRGKIIVDVRRHAKYLVFQLNQGSLINHLGMTGSWRFEKSKDKIEKHDHFVLNLRSGFLIYKDPRRFGMIDYFEGKFSKEYPRFQKLGVDPFLSKEFSPEYIFTSTRNRKVNIKSFLLNQNIIVGIGNIYASEILFDAAISPFLQAFELTEKQSARIYKSSLKILKKAIKQGGSTISDFRTAGGSKGYFQTSFKVYGKQNKVCACCKAKIQKSVQNQRSTFYCISCQNVNVKNII